RTATISQKHKLMSFTFYPKMPRQVVMISITHKVGMEEIESTFNVTVGSNVTQEITSNNETKVEEKQENSSNIETNPPPNQEKVDSEGLNGLESRKLLTLIK